MTPKAKKEEKVAVYPGTFDPVTNGHLDVIGRGAKLFDRVLVAVAVNTSKTPLFTCAERVAMLEAEVKRFGNVTVDSFQGLAVRYARERGASVLLRGVRTFSDFEYEFQMALTNRTLDDSIETLFVISSVEWSFTSSRLLKEALEMGADIGRFVPAAVHTAMKERLWKREP